MAKLPGINYQTPTRSMGRHDVYGPMRVANAQADALRKTGELVVEVDKMYQGHEADKGTQAYTKAVHDVAVADAKQKTLPPSETSQQDWDEEVQLIKAKYDTPELSLYARDSFQKQWKEFEPRARTNFAVNHVVALNREGRAKSAAHVEVLAKEGNINLALETIENYTMFSDSEKAVMATEAKITHEVTNIENVMARGDSVELAMHMELYSSDDYMGELGEAQRHTVEGWLKRAHDTAVAGELAFDQQARAEAASNLEILVKTGQPEGSPVNIQQAFNNDIITGPKRTELMLAWDRQQEEATATAERAAFISNSIETQQPLDPKNPIHKQAVAEAYQSRMDLADNSNLLPAEKIQARQAAFEYGIKLTTATNIMPAAMEADFRMHAIAGTPRAVRYLANAYETLERTAPQTLDKIGTEYQAIYGTVAKLSRAGMDLTDAVDIARKNAKANPEVRAELKTRYQAEEKSPDERLQSSIDSSDMDINIWGTPKATPAMSASYAALENEFYQLTDGDMEIASDLAFREVRRVFSTTEINGKARPMPYAPERQTGMSTEKLRAQLKTIALKHKVPIDSITVVPDGQTARDTGTKSYSLWANDDLGLPMPLIGKNGLPVRWTPDVEANRQANNAEARAEWELAKKKREVEAAAIEQIRAVPSPLQQIIDQNVVVDDQSPVDDSGNFFIPEMK